MDSGIILLIVIALIAVGITFVLSKIFTQRIIKYLPGLFLLFFSIYLVLTARAAPGGFDSLIRGIWGVFLFYGAVVALIAAAIIDYKKKRSK